LPSRANKKGDADGGNQLLTPCALTELKWTLALSIKNLRHVLTVLSIQYQSIQYQYCKLWYCIDRNNIPVIQKRGPHRSARVSPQSREISGESASCPQTWLSTDRQSCRLLYMSTSPERSYVQSTTRQLSKITNVQPLAPYRPLPVLMNVHRKPEAFGSFMNSCF